MGAENVSYTRLSIPRPSPMLEALRYRQTSARVNAAAPSFLRDRLLAVPLLLPFALLAVDPNWIFSGPFRDTWIYYGYFNNLSQYASEFSQHYYASRLSAILPGWVAHHLLPPLAANLVLHLALYWAAVFSFYTLCKLHLDRGVALLATLALGCHPFFLLAIGWNYVDGFGITYALAALALLALATHRSRWRLCLVLAGAAAMAMVTANLFYAVYLPWLAAYFLAVPAGTERRPLPQSLLLTGAGAAGLFVVFGAVNRAFGGPFLYLLSSLRFSYSATQQPNPFREATYQWLAKAAWLALPAAVCVGAVVLLARLRGEPDAARRRFLVFTQVQLLAFAALMAGLQLHADMGVLQYVYYGSLLLPPVFLALAGQIAEVLQETRPRVLALLAGVWGLALALPNPVDADPVSLQRWIGSPVVLSLLLGLVLALVLWLRARGPRAAAAFGLCLAASQFASWELTRYSRTFGPFGDDGRGTFLQISRSFDEIDAQRFQDPGRTREVPRIWYNFDEPAHGQFYDVIATTFMLCSHLLNTGFPNVDSKGLMCDGAYLEPGTRIAVLSTDPGAYAKAEASLRGIGFSTRLIARREVPGPVEGFAITFLEADAP